MAPLSPLSEHSAAAEPVIQTHARRLAVRLGMRSCEREDLEQDLWLALLEHWQATGLQLIESSRREQLPAHRLRQQVVEDVDCVVSLWLSAYRQQQRETVRTIHAASWMANGLAVARGDEDVRRELRLDLACALARLPDDLRAFCHDVMNDEPDAPLWTNTRNRDAGCAARLASLRRIFQANDLHRYIQPL